jgi:arginine repressor
MELAIKVLLDKRPWIYQDEIAKFLLEGLDVIVHQLTISRTLKRIHITRKKLTVVAA